DGDGDALRSDAGGPPAAVADLRDRRLLHQRRYRRSLRDHRAGVPNARARVRHRVRDRRRTRRLGTRADHCRVSLRRGSHTAGRRDDPRVRVADWCLRADSAQSRRRPMRHSDTRILTTHVGSIVRSPDLLQLAADTRDKPDDRPRYAAALTRATADIVARQQEVGLDIVNDGEYGKSSWANYVLDRMTGFEPRPDTLFEAVWLGRDRARFSEFMKAEFPRGAVGSPGHACVGPIRYQGVESIRRNISDLKTAVERNGV